MRTITQADINLVKQRNKKVRMKVSLLSSNGTVIEEIVGKVMPSPSYEIDSGSDIRKTCSISLAVEDKDQMELDFESTWNDRMVQLSCGIYSFSQNDYVWYPLGRMLMTSGSTAYSATTQQINLNLVDLMASMTAERGNQLGVILKIEAGSVIKDVIESIVSIYSDFKLTNVCNFPDTIPYDIEQNVGDYPIDALKSILELFPYYEMFYNNDGVFTVQEIPTRLEDPVDIGHEIIDDLLISENVDVDFAEVKNTTEIWGAEISGDYFVNSCTQSNGTYIGKIDNSFNTLETNKKFTIIPNSNSVSNQKLKLEDTATCPIVIQSGVSTYTAIPAGTLKADTGYVVRYYDGKFIYEGELLVRCIVQEMNCDPSDLSEQEKLRYKQENSCNNVKWIFNEGNSLACTVNNVTGHIMGEKRQVLKDSEYSKIYTLELAYERATYENWQKCRIQDKVSLEMILIPWMDVNDKIEYTSPVSGDVGTWLVNSISYNFQNWTMTVGASRFYETDPFDS